MANTFSLIASATITSGAGSLTFTGIPQTFTHLCLLISARDNDPGTLSGYNMDINGTTYGSNRQFYGYQSTFTNSGTSGEAGGAAGGGSTSNLFGNITIYIPNYTNTNAAKTSYAFGAVLNAGNTQGYVSLTSGPNAPTGAVTSITLGGGGTVTSSTAYLYGLAST